MIAVITFSRLTSSSLSPVLIFLGIWAWHQNKEDAWKKRCIPYSIYRGHMVMTRHCFSDDGSGRGSWYPVIDGISLLEGAGTAEQATRYAKAFIRTGNHEKAYLYAHKKPI